MKMRKHEQEIDDSPTKEDLYYKFHMLTAELFREEDSRAERHYFLPGEELFTLRSRVVRRIALFEASGPAFTEANKADVGL